MVRFILSQVLALIFTASFAQHQEAGCGTVLDEATHQRISKKLADYQASILSGRALMSNEPIDKIAITAHIVRRGDGTGGLTEAQLRTAVADMNEYYVNAGIEFIIFDEIDYIDSDVYFDFDSNYEDEMAGPRDVDNTINIYFVNDLTSGSTPLCGYAYFPGNQGHEDRILMAFDCTIRGTTLPHELGHYFTLYHTHGRTNTGTTDELVDGSNCTTAGDELCDTSADPNLTGVVDANCVYTGTARDANGDLFRPDPANIMSYSRDECQRLFSPEQYARIRDGFLSSRSYLHQKEYLADFSTGMRVACVTDQISFTDLSRGDVQNVLWEFEGGSPAQSTELTPSVQYNTPGVYDVTLTVFGSDGGSDVKFISDAVTIVDYNQGLVQGIDENFESPMAAGYTTFSPEDAKTFSQSEHGYQSSGSISMDFFNYEERDREDYLLFNALENPGSEDNILSFDYAYTYYAQTGENEAVDEVSILYKGCDGWETVWTSNGTEGATTDPKFIEFIPTEEEWAHVETYLPVPDGSGFVQLAVRTVNGSGNNFYLDNLMVKRSTSLVVRNIEVVKEQCSGDQTGKIIAEASFNGQEVLYSLDDVTYSANGTFENLAAGDYTVYITSGAEKLEEMATVGSQNASPAQPFIIFADDELRLLATEEEIEWYFNDELIDDSGTGTIEYRGPGTYRVTVRNASGCESTSEPFVVLGAEDELAEISVFPNPVIDKLNIRLGGQKEIELSIVDLAGNQISKTENFNQESVDLTHLSEGIYLLIFKSENTTRTLKVIKQ